MGTLKATKRSAAAGDKVEAVGAGSVRIKPPSFGIAQIGIRGTSPLVIHAFGKKALKQMHEKQAGGTAASSKKNRSKKDFIKEYESAKHLSSKGWCGIHAGAFRNAMISACRLVNFRMTLAKLSVTVIADGYDRHSSEPLVRITKGEPIYHEGPVRLADGSMDLRARPMWLPGWEAIVTIRFDMDQFTLDDVHNLMTRVGMQVGLCEGRNDSKKSAGLGWGEFALFDLTRRKKSSVA